QSPTGGGGESPGDTAGETSGDSDSAAPLPAAAESTVDSPAAPLLAVTEPAANWPAPTTSAPSASAPTKSAPTSPVVGHTKMPTVSRIDDGMPAASPGGSAESPSFRPDPTVLAESAARSTEPMTDLIPAAGRAPLADKLPPAATPVQRHAEPP